MTREEAEKYANNMTYRDAINNLMKARCIPYRKATFIKVNELLKVLEQEPYDDAKYHEEHGEVIVDKAVWEDAKRALEKEPKTGYWIEKDDFLHVCSECGQYIYSVTEHDLLEFHAFCGRCGARMVEPQESEVSNDRDMEKHKRV